MADAPWKVDEGSIIFPMTSKALKVRSKLYTQEQLALARWEKILQDNNFGKDVYYQHWQHFCEFTRYTEVIIGPSPSKTKISHMVVASIIKTWNSAVFDWAVKLANEEAQISNPGVNMFSLWLDDILQRQQSQTTGFHWRKLNQLPAGESTISHLISSFHLEKPYICSDTEDSDISDAEEECTPVTPPPQSLPDAEIDIQTAT